MRGINELNNIYGKLKVISLGKKTKEGLYWICECECGKQEEILGTYLRKGIKTSCKSCKSLEKSGMQIGDKIGFLTLSKPLGLMKKSSDDRKRFYWECKCDCGNNAIIRADRLKNGHTKTCGHCLFPLGISYDTEKINQLLKSNNISYETEKILFLKYKFDFYINNQYIIEYDGAQHFTNAWNSYESTHNNDLIKNKYCFDNNIPLIRIPYDAEYDLNDLKLETTRFLLTPENEEKYYATRVASKLVLVRD